MRYNVSNLTICGGFSLVIKEQKPYDHVYQRVLFPLILLYFILFMKGKIRLNVVLFMPIEEGKL